MVVESSNDAKRRKLTKRRKLARQVRQLTVASFHDRLVEAKVSRAFVIYENGEFLLSHPKILAPVQAFLELSQDFAGHEAIFIGRADEVPTLFFAFVHDTRRGLAQGGLRFKSYPNLAEVIVDGMRLSQGMTRKNALAGLWWGGGKGIIPVSEQMKDERFTTTPEDGSEPSAERRAVFAAYGRFVASLRGVYYTAEDVGTNTPDMNSVLGVNRFTTCIGPELGGSGNPSPFTAKGVLRGMQAAWTFLAERGEISGVAEGAAGAPSLRGVKVAVQGAGNVGAPLIDLLEKEGAEVWVSDVSEAALAAVRDRHPDVHVVGVDEIYDLEADIFAPCAIGATVNAETIPRLKVKLICGAANNILREDEADARRLRRANVRFVPDYVVNRMGITNCADEWHGYLQEDIRLAAEKVYPDSLRVLRHAHNLSVSATKAANQLADAEASVLHPLLGHRGRRIIDHLVATGWHRDRDGRERARGPLPFEPQIDEPELQLAWEHRGFKGDGPRLAAAPVTTAVRPNLATVLSALLLDVQVRADERSEERRPRRILGSDHGGHALQVAVERSLSHRRDQMGRSLFVEKCGDRYRRNDAAIREQLHQLGVGFDSREWLDPMNEKGIRAGERLFYELSDAGAIRRAMRVARHCPSCETVLVDSDVKRSTVNLTEKHRLCFITSQGREVDALIHYPELVVGIAALAVNPAGKFGDLIGDTVTSPVDDRKIPLVGLEELGPETEAEIVVPSYSKTDYERAQALGILVGANGSGSKSPNRISKIRPVFDGKGRICFSQGLELSREEARKRVLESFGGRAFQEAETDPVEVLRCRRCDTIVYPSFSEELYVYFDSAVDRLRTKIANDSVQFSHCEWKKRVLRQLNELEPWCISRQLWWGNPIPTHPEEVFSTWFSLAAWALQGAGWPENPVPDPVSRVFVSPELLFRWIVPSQLVSLILTGRPVFRRVEVHGTVNVLARKLVERQEVPEGSSDEERFIFHNVRRPMRRRLGNIVEPGVLVRRFGADALRLGLLLCCKSGFQKTVTASETQFRYARRLQRKFVAKLKWLDALFGKHAAGECSILDQWIVSEAAVAARRARAAYSEARHADAARELADLLEAYSRYATLAAGRRDGDDLGAARAVTVAFVRRAAEAFGPICPFMFGRLGSWIEEHEAPGESEPEVEEWLIGLLRELKRPRKGPIEIGCRDAELRRRLESSACELARLAKGEVSVTETPAAGAATVVGRVVIVKSSKKLTVLGESQTAKWYRELHPTND